MFLETARSKSRSRAPPAASGGVRHVAGGWGKSTPSHQPGALGSFLGVKAKPLRGRCASLDPHPSDSAPQAPARASGAFSSGGRVKGLVRPAAPQGRGHGPLTRPERPKPAGRVSGALFPRHPCPSAKAPAGPPEGAVRRAVQGAPPAWGSKGRAAALGPAQRTKNPLPKASIFCSSSFALRLFTAPRRGPKSETEGNPGKPRIAGFWASQCNLPRLPCSL